MIMMTTRFAPKITEQEAATSQFLYGCGWATPGSSTGYKRHYRYRPVTCVPCRNDHRVKSQEANESRKLARQQVRQREADTVAAVNQFLYGCGWATPDTISGYNRHRHIGSSCSFCLEMANAMNRRNYNTRVAPYNKNQQAQKQNSAALRQFLFGCGHARGEASQAGRAQHLEENSPICSACYEDANAYARSRNHLRPPQKATAPYRCWFPADLAAAGFSCLACGSRKNLTIDHIVPQRYGGTHYITNLQVLCQTCNSRKGIKIIDYRYQRMLPEKEVG